MRLKYLWIKEYKNLKDLHINFENNNGLTMLVGTNGSGKSNILELILQAYFDSNYGIHTAHCVYSLFYEFDNKLINIVSNENSSYVFEFGAKTQANIIDFSYSNFIEQEWGAEAHPLSKDTNGRPNYKNISDLIFTTLEFANDYGKLHANQLIPLTGKLCIHIPTKLQKQSILPVNIIMIYSGESFRMRKLFGKKHSKMLFVDNSHAQIALIVYMLSYLENCELFISDTLNINSINDVEIKINYSQIKDEYKQVFQFIQEEFGVQGEDETVNINEPFRIFKKRFTENFISATTNELEYINALKHDEQKIFNAFVSGISNKAISDVKVIFNDDLTIDDLSEGEKRQLLLHALLEFISFDNSIILMDEPDAYIHESKKSEFYSLFETYCKIHNRNIILTTHSPTLLDIADENQICALKSIDGRPHTISAQLLRQYRDFMGSLGNVLSLKSILVTEGPGDIGYIKKAIEKLNTENKYDSLEFDYAYTGGTTNVKNFKDNASDLLSGRKLIFIFDGDNAGVKALCAAIGKQEFDASKHSDNDKASKYVKTRDKDKIYRKNGIIYLLSKKPTDSEDNWTIEDYLPKTIRQNCATDCVLEVNGYMLNFHKDLQGTVKTKLYKKLDSYSTEDLKDFEVILNSLLGIIDGTAVIEEV